MKQLSIWGALLLIALFGNACEKQVLEATPKGELAEGVSNATTVDRTVIAAYQGLMAHYFGNDESFAGPSSNWIFDVMTDDAIKGGGGIADRSDIHQLETYTMDPTSYPAFQEWRNSLFSIARCNLAIQEINALDDLSYPKDNRTAEMRLLRGHFHFEMLRIFGQIPYLDENADPTATSNTQYTEDELWSLIEDDFRFALDNLPVDQDEIGRVNRYVAAAYLAKLYVERQQWSDVLDMVAIVKQGPFGLLDDFRQLSQLEFENGPEAVFTIQFSTANIFANHDWGNLLNVTQGPGIDNGAYANGDDFYHGSQNLVNAFRVDENGLPLFDSFNEDDVEDGNYNGALDPRVDFTFGRIGIPWKGTAIYDEAWIRSADYLGYSSKKAVIAPDDPNVHNSFPWAASGLNFCIIRYAEVLLWEAEALVELNSDLNQARDLVNEVRQRTQSSQYVRTLDGSSDAANYNIGLYPATGWTQDYAREAIRFERRLELAMEGHRFFDLKRWGLLDQVLNAYFQSEAENLSYLQGVTFTSGKHEVMPIPQTEIDLAPTLYTQNPNY